MPEPQPTHLVIATEFLPMSTAGEVTGGVEAYCHYVGRELERTHRVTFVAKRTDGASIDTATLGTLIGRVFFAARSVVSVLWSRADVVMGTNFVTHPVVWIAGRLLGSPVVFWYPDVLIGQWTNGSFGRSGIVFEIIEKSILRLRPDLYIAISETVAEKLRVNGADPERIVVIPCGYDPAEVDAVRSRKPQRRRQIVVVGRMVGYKRHDLVIQALAQLAPRHHDIELLIVGQGSNRAALERLAAELGVADRVEFTGHVTAHSEVLTHIASSTIFVSASEIEGFGIVVAEAMALGTPYVVSDIDVFVEVTGGGQGGLLFTSGDSSSLAAKLTELLDDPDLYASSASVATTWGRRYTWPEIAESTGEALATLRPKRSGRFRRHRRGRN